MFIKPFELVQPMTHSVGAHPSLLVVSICTFLASQFGLIALETYGGDDAVGSKKQELDLVFSRYC